MNERIGALSTLKLWIRKEPQARELLERYSNEQLFAIHGNLNRRSISYWYKKWKEKPNHEYAVGSFVVADVSRDRRIIQIHFMPFNTPEKSINPVTIMEAMCLGLADAEKMFEIVEMLHETYGINEFFGQAKKEMALIAQEFGLKVRNNKINSYNNILSTQDIPDFLQQARKKLNQMRAKNERKFEEHGITEREARINAILRFMGKL
jgi:hypothetical protein